MKSKVIVTIMLTLFAAHSQATAIDQSARDYKIICEISKVAKDLAESNEFKDPVIRAQIISEMLNIGTKTKTVHTVFSVIANADSEGRISLLRQSAKEAGLKNWTCETLPDLYK